MLYYAAQTTPLLPRVEARSSAGLYLILHLPKVEICGILRLGAIGRILSKSGHAMALCNTNAMPCYAVRWQSITSYHSHMLPPYLQIWSRCGPLHVQWETQTSDNPQGERVCLADIQLWLISRLGWTCSYKAASVPCIPVEGSIRLRSSRYPALVCWTGLHDFLPPCHVMSSHIWSPDTGRY